MTARRSNLIAIALFAASGCSAPNAANIALRKQVQTQQDQIVQLTRQHAADVASLKVQSTTAPSIALSSEQTNALFTTHGIRLGKLTGSTANALIVHVIPTDDAADDFKAAGAITVDAYDLTDAGTRAGHWAFTADEAKSFWNGTGLRYEYVVPCPWQQKPTAKDITLKVTFVDALTGRSFEVQQQLKLPAE